MRGPEAGHGAELVVGDAFLAPCFVSGAAEVPPLACRVALPPEGKSASCPPVSSHSESSCYLAGIFIRWIRVRLHSRSSLLVVSLSAVPAQSDSHLKDSLFYHKASLSSSGLDGACGSRIGPGFIREIDRESVRPAEAHGQVQGTMSRNNSE